MSDELEEFEAKLKALRPIGPSQIARERNCGRLEWSVLEWNRPAIEFYQRLGATVMPDWRICRVTGDALAQLGAPGR